MAKDVTPFRDYTSFDTTDGKPETFQVYRTDMAGTNVDSNIMKIDADMQGAYDGIDDLAGGGRTTETIIGNATDINTLKTRTSLGDIHSVSTSGTDTYTATNPYIESYYDKLKISVKIGILNTGASTININTLGTISLKKQDGSEFLAGELKAGESYPFEYNGTEFRSLIPFIGALEDELDNHIGSTGASHGVATEALNGFMSASDKARLNELTGIEANNAGSHNSIYRGKYLGSSVTAAQYTAISSGIFEDLYIGDYWTIGGVNYRIACFDYYYNTGDVALTTHHAVIVPDKALYDAQMNSTNITTGAYVGSEMYTTNLATAKTTINNAFSGHVITHRNYLHNATTDGYSSGGSWYDSDIELMTEANLYGTKHYGNAIQGTALANNVYVDKSQYPLFVFDPQMICNRDTFWLRDVASATLFALAHFYGFSNFSVASYSLGVRPAFCIS